MTESPLLITPYGGSLIDLITKADEADELFETASALHSIQITKRQACDLEMLATGGFSPLKGFMGKADHKSVVENMRLADGTVFPIPITLSADNTDGLKIGSSIALRDERNELLAVMDVEEIYEWDKRAVMEKVFGTTDLRHPLVAEMHRWGRYNLAGRLRVLKTPSYNDFTDLRLRPKEVRSRLSAMGRSSVVAFQTRNPIHFAHEVMTKRAAEITGGTLLVHPVCGMTKEGDIDHFTRVRTYKIVVSKAYKEGTAMLALLPLAMRMAGPREAVWHAIIRRNYGAGHFIVGRDHASPGTDSHGKPFYGPYDAQELAKGLENETGVKVLAFHEFAYLPDEGRYEETDKIEARKRVFTISGTQLREDHLGKGKKLPEWFTRPEVAEILASAYPPKHQQGFCIWFTGLSGAGKSTTAELFVSRLLEEGRQATLLDGDVVRTHLSRGLGFSKEDRDINVSRIGFVASEIARHGGVAVCAAVSPYRESRNHVRQMFREGHFIEIFVDTPLEVCEKRDTKGMYAKARRGEIRDFTGIDDAYEVPDAPEITLVTETDTAEANVALILDHLRDAGFIRNEGLQTELN